MAQAASPAASRRGGGSVLNVMPFAKGGVVATPSYFPLGNTLGVAGERGAEAILPLARGGDGRLGVRAENSNLVFLREDIVATATVEIVSSIALFA